MTIQDGAGRNGEGSSAECAAAQDLGHPGGHRSVPGTGSRMRWFFSGVWLVYLIQPIADLSGGRHGALWVAGGVAIVAVFCAVYLAVVSLWGLNPRRALPGLAVLFVLAVLACLIYGSDWTGLWIYISCAAGFVIPVPRRAMLAVLVVGACYALLAWLTHAGAEQFLVLLVPTVLVGWAMTGFRMQIALIRELGQARETVARLAANEERLRFARDLHDLTGHSLSLVTLKAELVQRMLDRLPASPERDRAARDVADIERVSRQTLHDIREAVSGYRRPTLAAEFVTARTALEAAGIRLDAEPALPQWPLPDGGDPEAALAWFLREAVTNVIRHSGAASCRIRLAAGDGALSLEVADDGRGVPGAPADAVIAVRGDGASGGSAAVPVPSAGSGLHGMAERLSAVGGRLSASTARPGRENGGGFRLVATVPAAGQAAERDPEHAGPAGVHAGGPGAIVNMAQ